MYIHAYLYNTQREEEEGEREEEQEGKAAKKTLLMMKKQQPLPVDVISVCNQKGIQIRKDSIYSRFRAGSKLTTECSPLQYVVFCLLPLIVATVQTSFGYLALTGLPELALSPGLSCWSVEYSSERFYSET